ncbi:MAG TPA: hypothetical protein EYP41_04160, partial [Anaerolineae bacterium]|nr:hypothetical protein [Anaerolineae bacterium]
MLCIVYFGAVNAGRMRSGCRAAFAHHCANGRITRNGRASKRRFARRRAAGQPCADPAACGCNGDCAAHGRRPGAAGC